MIKAGTWVKIEDTVLESQNRAPQLPEDTKGVPLLMWTKGYLMENGVMNEYSTVKTITGRIVRGRIIEVEPFYQHNYGDFVPELMEIGKKARSQLWGGEWNA